jgi:hypothetical protein
VSLDGIQPRDALDILYQAETLTHFQRLVIQSLIDADRRDDAARVLALVVTPLEPWALEQRLARDALVAHIGERLRESAPAP